MRKPALTLIFCLCTVFGFAVSFSSKDKGFSISLPSKWQNEATKDTQVLNLQNGANKIIVIPLDKCNQVDCLEKIIKNRIKQVKSKKFKLIKNTYSGEEIKRTEFSTLDPLLSFSYIADDTNYTEGYFLADSKGYKIEVVGLSDVDAAVNLSFITPKPKEIQDLPLITEEKPLIEENIIVPEIQETQRQTLAQTFSSKQSLQNKKENKISISKKFSSIIFLVFIYIFVAVSFFFYNIFFAQKPDKTPTNPKSFYPIRGARLYGSPDLFLRLYDSQGQNFVVTSQRWSSFLMEFGFYGTLFFLFLHFVVESLTNQGPGTNTVLVNTFLSLCYLFAIFGLIFMLSGKVLNILFPPAIYIYTDKGTILFKIIRRGSGILNYAYLVLTNNDAILFRLETPKLFLLRKFMLLDKTGRLAIIKEKSLPKAIARKIFGHLGGTLRASYTVEGKNESKGEILSLRRINTQFQADINKPQAISPSAMLAVLAVIFVIDRDKYYPWFN